MEKDVAILDLGSHKLVFARARKSKKGIYNISKFSSVDYPGFFEGKWVEGELLGADISKVIEKSGFSHDLQTVYVGVPSSFITIETQEMSKDFGKEKLLTAGILEEFLSDCQPRTVDSTYTIISSSAIKYILDGNKEVTNAVDERATRLTATVSFVLCKKSFCKMFDSILAVEGFENIAYISSTWAQNCKLLDFETKNKSAIIIDIGFVTTTFAYQKGEGIAFLKTVSIGGANIADDLAQSLYCDFFEARKLLLKVNLDIYDTTDKEFDVTIGTEVYKVNAHHVNHVIKFCIDNFAKFILGCAASLDKPIEKLPLFITGGGITAIRGAVPYLEKELKHTMQVLEADVPQYDNPSDTSFIAVLDVANDINSDKKKLKKLFS